MRNKLPSSTKQLLALYLLVPALILTMAVIGEPQTLLQYAQTFTEPPLYGCLQVGQGDKATCASKLGITTEYTLTLHDRPLEKEMTVYYGDRLKGSVKFTNVGDLPIELKNVGLNVETAGKKVTRDFQPIHGKTKLAPRESVTVNNATYKFTMPDPNNQWTAGSKIVVASGEEIPTLDVKQKLTVNAACTALRIQELTDKDRKNIKAFCGKNPQNKLCTSKQYCEIFNGKNCSKPNVSNDTPGWQCDEWIVPDKPEQDILEELCRVHPDTDACVRFCERAIESSICPKKTVWVDKKTGKELVPQPTIIPEPQSHLLGAKTSTAIEQQKREEEKKLIALCVLGIGNCAPPAPPPPRAPGRYSAGAGYVPGQGTSMRPASPPAPKVVPAGTGCDKHPGCGRGTVVQRAPLPSVRRTGNSGPAKKPNLYSLMRQIGSRDCVESGAQQLGQGIFSPNGANCTPIQAEPNLPKGCTRLATCYAAPQPRSPGNAQPSPNGHRPCSYDGSFDIKTGGICRSIHFDPRGILPKVRITQRNPEGTLSSDPKQEETITPVDLIPVSRLWRGIKLGGHALASAIRPHIGAGVPEDLPTPPPPNRGGQSCNQTMKQYCDRMSPGRLQDDCRRGPALRGCY